MFKIAKTVAIIFPSIATHTYWLDSLQLIKDWKIKMFFIKMPLTMC